VVNFGYYMELQGLYMTSNIISVENGVGEHCKIYTLKESGIERRVTVFDYEAAALEAYLVPKMPGSEEMRTSNQPTQSIEARPAPRFRTRQPFGIPGLE
jgi:hypothetical protein